MIGRAVHDRRLGQGVTVRTDEVGHDVSGTVAIEVQPDETPETCAAVRIDQTAVDAVEDARVGPRDRTIRSVDDELDALGGISGNHQGEEAVFGLFALCGELSGGTLQVVPETITAQGDDTVVSTHRVTAKRNGKELDLMEKENITIRDGTIVIVVESVSDQAASDVFWV